MSPPRLSKRRFAAILAIVALFSLTGQPPPAQAHSQTRPNRAPLPSLTGGATAAHDIESESKQPSRASAAKPAQITLLVTHPLRHVLENYVLLVQKKIIQIPNLRILGIYHISEAEDYADAQTYLDENHLDWITLNPIKCPLTIDDVYRNNSCRPVIAKLLAQSQGAVFNGGDDIPPFLYGQPTLLTTNVQTPRRHLFETAMLVQMMGSTKAPKVHPLMTEHRNYAVLGICVGMQTMNIAAGGTLFQDIPSQLYHQTSSDEALSGSASLWHRNHSHELGLGSDEGVSLGVMHPVHITPSATAFMQTASEHGTKEPAVLSIHHQAVDQVGVGYTVFATSDDGRIIESIGRHDFPNVLGVQFHPERRAMWDSTIREQVAPNAKEYNFVFGAVTRDPHARAINLGVWQWLAERVERAPLKGAGHQS